MAKKTAKITIENVPSARFFMRVLIRQNKIYDPKLAENELDALERAGYLTRQTTGLVRFVEITEKGKTFKF